MMNLISNIEGSKGFSDCWLSLKIYSPPPFIVPHELYHQICNCELRFDKNFLYYLKQ